MNRRQFNAGLALSAVSMAIIQRPLRIEIWTAVDPVSSGNPVFFTLTKPNGTVVTANGLTDINGVSIADFTLRKKDPHGTYNGQVVITVGDQTCSANDLLII